MKHALIREGHGNARSYVDGKQTSLVVDLERVDDVLRVMCGGGMSLEEANTRLRELMRTGRTEWKEGTGT